MLNRNIWKISVALASSSTICEQTLKFTDHLISVNRVTVTVTPQICTKKYSILLLQHLMIQRLFKDTV